MACFTPLKAYYAPGGGVVFDSKVGYGDRPLELACGQCIGCRAERARQWAIRCVHESQLHSANCFITLTYDNEHLPEDGGLDVRHWQLFAKRLRKAIGPFRFFHCGEYGDATRRPHYHACIFGADFSSDRILLRENGFNSLYVSPLLTRTWGLGHCSVGALTYESAAYVARYVMKKATGPKAESEYLRVDADTGECWAVKPPYITMSRRPGIASAWFDKFVDDVYPEDTVVYDGRRFRPPRFYDGKLSSLNADLDGVDGPAMIEGLKSKRRRLASLRGEDLTPSRLRTREKCATASADRFRRSL